MADGLKSISGMADYEFYIPDYQRGYRWTNEHIDNLLDDLANHVLKTGEGTPFFLEPLVVSEKGEKRFELIDGQQRLTTLFLLAHILAALYSPPKHPRKPVQYKLIYPESGGNQGFMDAIAADPLREAWEDADSCPDFHFIANACTRIRQWAEREENEKAALAILNRLKDDVQFLWHDTSAEQASAAETFERLNTGKIALTDAELCRSLLLARQNVDGELPQLKGFSDEDKKALMPRLRSSLIARRQIIQADNWDDGERLLHNEGFWAFLGLADDTATRMDYLLRLHYDLTPEYQGHYVCFDKLYKGLGKDEAAEMFDGHAAWGFLKRSLQQLWDWYNDPDFYHWIGYLNRINKRHLPKLLQIARQNTVPEFRLEVLERIKKSIGKPDLEDIKYEPGSDSPSRRLLLLFNVEYARKRPKGYARFPFSQYGQNLSIEHISPRNPKAPETAAEIREFLRTRKDYLAALTRSDLEQLFAPVNGEAESNTEDWDEEAYAAHESVEKDIDALLEERDELLGDFAAISEEFAKLKKEDRVGDLVERFKPLYEQYENFMGRIEEIDDVDEIYNLCLLDKDLNTSLSNGEFKDKQKKARAILASGNAYIPPASQAVFMRHFMEKAFDCPFWSKHDRKAYARMLRETLGKFWPELKKNDEEATANG